VSGFLESAPVAPLASLWRLLPATYGS
jgi:hypothetical protein